MMKSMGLKDISPCKYNCGGPLPLSMLQTRKATFIVIITAFYIDMTQLPSKTCKPTITGCSNSNYLHKHFCLVQSFSFCHQYPVCTDEPHPVLFSFCLFTYNALTSSSGFLESIMTFPVL